MIPPFLGFSSFNLDHNQVQHSKVCAGMTFLSGLDPVMMKLRQALPPRSCVDLLYVLTWNCPVDLCNLGCTEAPHCKGNHSLDPFLFYEAPCFTAFVMRF